MLSDYLKKNSRKDHDSIENSIDLLKFSTDLNQYTNLIKAFYGYYISVEKSLLPFEKDFSKIGIDLIERSKINLLKDDLHKCGLRDEEITNLPVCTKIPKVTDLSEAMGVLYVLEGSTLGGQIITRTLSESSILKNDGERGKFFNAYGTRTREMWMSFKTSLDTLPEEDSERVLGTAKNTFNTMESWLAERLTP